jgi:hypothetical protein
VARQQCGVLLRRIMFIRCIRLVHQSVRADLWLCRSDSDSSDNDREAISQALTTKPGSPASNGCQDGQDIAA